MKKLLTRGGGRVLLRIWFSTCSVKRAKIQIFKGKTVISSQIVSCCSFFWGIFFLNFFVLLIQKKLIMIMITIFTEISTWLFHNQTSIVLEHHSGGKREKIFTRKKRRRKKITLWWQFLIKLIMPIFYSVGMESNLSKICWFAWQLIFLKRGWLCPKRIVTGCNPKFATISSIQ